MPCLFLSYDDGGIDYLGGVDEERCQRIPFSTFFIDNLTNKHRSFLSSKKDAILSIVQQDKTAVVRYRINTTPHGEPAISDQSMGKC